MSTDQNEYTTADIVHKEGVDAVRQCIAMYAGDVSYNGFHQLASEVIDNSLDEYLAGFATKLKIILHKDESCSVEDNGRGIPAEIHPEYKVSTLEVSLSRLNSSGKFNKTAYKKFSSGLHGIGLKLANFCSNWLEATVVRDGHAYYQKYVEGVAQAPVKVIGNSKSHGTVIRFKPSNKLFRDVDRLDRQWFLKRLRDLAYLNPGVIISFKDERDTPCEEVFQQKNGISDYVTTLAGSSDRLMKSNFNLSISEPDGHVKDDNTQEDMKIDLSFNYTDQDSDIILCFTNNIFNKDGGTHSTAFQMTMTSAFNNYIKKNPDIISKADQKLIGDKPLRGEDYKQGLIAIISLKLSRPQFAGQTKDRLTNPETLGAVRTALGKHLNKWIEENPSDAKKIVERAVLNYRMHLASKRAAETVKKDTKSLIGSSKKLKDCTENDPTKTELFLVEGDSAGGSAINGRDPSFQAVLSLGGKILNTWKATTQKMLQHEEISSIIKALGAGILDSFSADNCKYNKIIIMCDADVDGLHIRSLLLTFFYQRMRKLIEDGKVYIAQAPLYKVQFNNRKTKCSFCNGQSKKLSICGTCGGSGKETAYITNDTELQSLIKLEGEKGLSVMRYKGLGEMTEQQIYHSTMNPATRKLLKIQIADIVDANNKFDILMGDKAEPRRNFIIEKKLY